MLHKLRIAYTNHLTTGPSRLAYDKEVAQPG
jgi:hypothetical protein